MKSTDASRYYLVNGDALPVSQRLRGQSGGARKKFACPLAAAPKG